MLPRLLDQRMKCLSRELKGVRPAVAARAYRHRGPPATGFARTQRPWPISALADRASTVHSSDFGQRTDGGSGPNEASREVYTEVLGNDGKLQEKEQLWYANASSSANEVFKGDKGSIAVLAWTHPGIIQLALATDLGDCRDIRANGLRLRSVEPLTQG